MARVNDEGAGYRIQRRVGIGKFTNCKGQRNMPTREIAKARFKQLVRDLENAPPGLGRMPRTVEYRLVAMMPFELDRYIVARDP